MQRRRYYSPLTNAVAIITILWFIIGLAVHLWWIEPMAGGLRAPDTRVTGYTFEGIQPWFAAMGGGEARDFFLLWHTAVLDRVLPWLLALGMYLVLRETLSAFPRFARQAEVVKSGFPLLLILPYLILDLLENRQIAAMLTGRLALDHANVNLASAYTIAKFCSLLAAFAVIAVFTLRLRASHKGPSS